MTNVSAEAVEELAKKWERFARNYPATRSMTGDILKECAAELRALLPAQSPPADPLVQQERIDLEDGTWTVTIKDGNHLQIADASGRNRHHSVGQMSTGIHFAMTLAKQPFHSSEQLDRMLQHSAKVFTESARGGVEPVASQAEKSMNHIFPSPPSFDCRARERKTGELVIAARDGDTGFCVVRGNGVIEEWLSNDFESEFETISRQPPAPEQKNWAVIEQEAAK